MPLNPETLTKARKLTTQIFQFLEELNRRKNPVVREIKDQLWSLSFAEIPIHKCIQWGAHAGTTRADQFAIRSDDYLLRVLRAEKTPPPQPPVEIERWIMGTWDDPGSRPDFHERIEPPSAESSHTSEAFEDSLARLSAWDVWEAQWKEWAVVEKGNRSALRLFEQIYGLYGIITREAESVELVLGDGILNWCVSGIGINHPVLLQRLQLTFVPETPEFILQESDEAVELYSALVSGISEVDGAAIGRSREELSLGDYHPLDGEATSGYLRSFVNRLSAQGQFIESNRVSGQVDYPRLFRNPVIFMRKRSLGFATALEAILQDIQDREDIPAAFLNICGIEAPEPEFADAEEFIPSGLSPEDVLLSKPANVEQIQIAQRLDKHNCVLVQGPPGTGKTHTIANLVGHLLAQGKSILITSHTTKALRVLRDQIVPQLQPLCVSVLDGSSESKQQLEVSINGIVERLSSSDADTLLKQGNDIAVQRSRKLRDYAGTRQALENARKDEYREIVISGRGYTPIEAARIVAQGADRFNWIPTPVHLGAPLPLAQGDLIDLYRTNDSVTPLDERELSLNLPSLDSLVPPETFSELIEEQRVLRQLQPLRKDIWGVAPENQTANSLEAIADWAENAATFCRQEPWILAVLDAGRQGAPHTDIWNSLISAIDQLHERAVNAQVTLIEKAPSLSPTSPPADQLATIEEIVYHLGSGGSLSWFVLLTRRTWKELLPGLRVNAREPKSLPDFQALLTLVTLEQERKTLAERWERQVTTLGGPSILKAAVPAEQAGRQYIDTIRRNLAWYPDKFDTFLAALPAQGLKWEPLLSEEPPMLVPCGDLLRIRDTLANRLIPIIRSRIKILRLIAIETRIATIRTSLERVEASANVAQQLLGATLSGNIEDYRNAYVRLAQLTRKSTDLVRRHELLARMERSAPGWSAAIRGRMGAHGLRELPGDCEQAWLWRQLHDELQQRASVSLDDLQKKVEDLYNGVQATTAELVDRRSWGFQVGRTTVKQQQALIGWLLLIKKIGAGKGLRVPKLQLEARKAMSQARSSVPVWIMPLSRVVESFNPRTDRFDVVITDEASQSDAMGLIALYFGKQVVIVGDHEQVSPTAVGQRLDVVDQLIEMYLKDVPNAALYDDQQSIYDLAWRSFGGLICLREHFRCVPEIIQFSNHLSYKGNIKPLRDTSSVKITPPTIAHRVDGKSTYNNVNEAEASAVASLLIAATEQQEYKDASFGVISLVGDEQSRLTETLLRLHMSPVEFERRRVVCGIPPQFQGDERDVIFLSIVDSGRDNGGPLALRQADMFKKRYNVAASRAKDQMWVVHSLDAANDLKPDDLRRRLIQHAENPNALQLEIERGEVRTESEFEKQVLRLLVSTGYKVTPQWHVGAYRIDMVVEGAGRRLAVECDGDQFHTQDNLAADMDRQAVLERLGWKFARIRGSVFFRDPERAMKPVFQRLQQLEIEPLFDFQSESNQSLKPADELKQRVIRRASELRREWIGNSEEDQGSLAFADTLF